MYRENQVKTVGLCKADKEGHGVDAIADAFFRVTLMVRFRRRSESQNSKIERIIDNLI